MAIARVREAAEETDEAPRSPEYGGTATILIVDDEPVVRAFASEVLGLEGYIVLEASGTAEGLRIAAGHPGPIDLVISDVVMPGGEDGRDLVERLGRVRPAIRPLYISGHCEADVARGAARAGAFLQKPFTMDMLVTTVRAVLDAAEATTKRG